MFLQMARIDRGGIIDRDCVTCTSANVRASTLTVQRLRSVLNIVSFKRVRQFVLFGCNVKISLCRYIL